MSLAHKFAEFVNQLDNDSIPAEVIEKAKVCLLNGYGIGVGCYNTPYAPIARKAAIGMNGIWKEGGATILGDGRKTSVAGATLANAALFHGRAQEDTCGAAHIGAIIIPLLTAIIESDGYATDDLIPAIVAGYEIGGILEKNFASITTPSGFRSSTLYGTLAAAAAAAKLMNLSVEQIQASIANAVSFSGGLLQSFVDGTDEWRYQVGVVAQTGYTAAKLAQAGSTSAPNAIEGKAGFIKAFTKQENTSFAEIASDLGKDWATLRVTFKPFPVCAFNQTPVTAGLAMKTQLEEKNIQLADVKHIKVRMNPYETSYPGMAEHGPFNSISGTLMSIPFCIANTLRYGAPDMKMMTTYDNEKTNALMKSIELLPDDSINPLCCSIDIELKNGLTVTHEQVMTTDDYAYNRKEVSELIRRVGSENNLPDKIYDEIEEFVDAPERHSIEKVIKSFSLLPN